MDAIAMAQGYGTIAERPPYLPRVNVFESTGQLERVLPQEPLAHAHAGL